MTEQLLGRRAVLDYAARDGHRAGNGEWAAPCQRCGTVALADLLWAVHDEHGSVAVVCKRCKGELAHVSTI